MSKMKENVTKFEDILKSAEEKNNDQCVVKASNDEGNKTTTDKDINLRGKPKSGRVWKEPKERMPGKSRKFIDKKNSVTFNLVYRSQRDPLIADENAPQRVLVPAHGVQSFNDNKKLTKEEINKRKEEQANYGIFFDDDYDYLQHLKKSDFQTELIESCAPRNQSSETKSKIVLPSSVFESNVEEDIGLLNRTAPTGLNDIIRLNLDPEILETLDDDTKFDFDNEDNLLEDNFMELGGGAVINDDNYEYDGNEMFEEEMDYDGSCNGDYDYDSNEEYDKFDSRPMSFQFKNEETKSRFSEYSASSSVIRRNKNLTLLDDKFEKMWETTYDDQDIGSLDGEEIEGDQELSDVLKQCVDEYNQENKDEVEKISKYIKDRVNFYESDDHDNNLDNLVVHEETKWDCESILSTYSNIYNHPRLISETKNKIEINPKTGMPTKVWVQGSDFKLTAKNLAQLNKEQTDEAQFEELRKLPQLNKCHRNETPEEKKERKQAVKNQKRERRIERKANITAFKEEKKRQGKIEINKRNNLQGQCIS